MNLRSIAAALLAASLVACGGGDSIFLTGSGDLSARITTDAATSSDKSDVKAVVSWDSLGAVPRSTVWLRVESSSTALVDWVAVTESGLRRAPDRVGEFVGIPPNGRLEGDVAPAPGDLDPILDVAICRVPIGEEFPDPSDLSIKSDGPIDIITKRFIWDLRVGGSPTGGDVQVLRIGAPTGTAPLNGATFSNWAQPGISAGAKFNIGSNGGTPLTFVPSIDSVTRALIGGSFASQLAVIPRFTSAEEIAVTANRILIQAEPTVWTVASWNETLNQWGGETAALAIPRDIAMQADGSAIVTDERAITRVRGGAAGAIEFVTEFSSVYVPRAPLYFLNALRIADDDAIAAFWDGADSIIYRSYSVSGIANFADVGETTVAGKPTQTVFAGTNALTTDQVNSFLHLVDFSTRDLPTAQSFSVPSPRDVTTIDEDDGSLHVYCANSLGLYWLHFSVTGKLLAQGQLPVPKTNAAFVAAGRDSSGDCWLYMNDEDTGDGVVMHSEGPPTAAMTYQFVK